MTKRSKKLFRQWRKENAGCMRGLISIFDFRHGRSSKRLLSIKRRGSGTNLGITNARNKVDLPYKMENNHGDVLSVIKFSDTESDEAAMVNPPVSSIGTLMEKDMSRAHHLRKEFSSKTKWIKAEFGTEPIFDKDHKETTANAQSSNEKLNASSISVSQQSDHPDIPAILSSESDLSTFMLDYCSDFLECEKNHYFFRKREKLRAVYQSNEGEDANGLDQIVVLKPTHVRNQSFSSMKAPTNPVSSHCDLKNNKQGKERLSSQFSLKEIRRRFRDVIGASRKEKHPIAMDGVLHKIPYGKQITSGTGNRGEERLGNRAYEERNVFSAASGIISHKKTSKNYAPRVLYTEASFCDEARKHLTDFLRIRSERDLLPPIHVSKTLGRILSFPGFNYLSPRLSPTREKEKVVHENRSSLLCPSKAKNDSEHLDLLKEKEGFLKNEIIEITEVEEVSQTEAKSVSIRNEDNISGESINEEGSSMLLEPDQLEERFEPSTPSTPITSKLQESKEMVCAMDDADRPSPISVLEPLFYEDINTPASILSWRLKGSDAETQTEPKDSQIDNSAPASGSNDDEPDSSPCTEFNKALLFDELEASYSKCVDDPKLLFEPDSSPCTEFNEALLFDELEASYSKYIDDPKLLFDSIDEVLTEIKDRHFSFISTSPTPSMKTTILQMHRHEYFMKEACRRIDRNLDVQFPSTLEKAVKKDLDCIVWIDLQFGAESTVSEVGDSILDYLFEEIAVEMWD